MAKLRFAGRPRYPETVEQKRARQADRAEAKAEKFHEEAERRLAAGAGGAAALKEQAQKLEAQAATIRASLKPDPTPKKGKPRSRNGAKPKGSRKGKA